MSQKFVKINDYITYIGVNDRETQLFESQWPIPDGISYNAYLLTGEKTVLMDTVKAFHLETFISYLDRALEGKTLDYLVVHHMEPDHSGGIELIRRLYPEVIIVGNKKTFEMIENFYKPIPEEYKRVVKSGETVELGNFKLTFYTTPMVHWPESMVSFLEEDGILFSQDIFGGYGSLRGAIFDDEINWTYHANDTARYYANIVGKYSRQAQGALKKLEGLDIKMLCPDHGPIWRENPGKIVEMYRQLATWQVEKGVVIAYGSMYGNTQAMAEYLGRELVENGVENVQLFDVAKAHPSYIMNEIWKHRGIILASCTYNNALFQPMRTLVDILKENKLQNHTLGVFGTFSWSGGALKELKAFAEGEKHYEVLDCMPEIKSGANEEDLKKLSQLAKEMAENLDSHKEDNVENILQL